LQKRIVILRSLLIVTLYNTVENFALYNAVENFAFYYESSELTNVDILKKAKFSQSELATTFTIYNVVKNY